MNESLVALDEIYNNTNWNKPLEMQFNIIKKYLQAFDIIINKAPYVNPFIEKMRDGTLHYRLYDNECYCYAEVSQEEYKIVEEILCQK